MSKTSYVSKGIVGRPMRTPATGAEKIMNRLRAYLKGKPVCISREFGVRKYANEEWALPTPENNS